METAAAAAAAVAPTASRFSFSLKDLFAGLKDLALVAGLIYLAYLHLHGPAAYDPNAQVKTVATDFRADEAGAYRRAKAKFTRTGDATKDEAALMEAIRDERKPKAQALSKAITSTTDWAGAMEAVAESFDSHTR